MSNYKLQINTKGTGSSKLWPRPPHTLEKCNTLIGSKPKIIRLTSRKYLQKVLISTFPRENWMFPVRAQLPVPEHQPESANPEGKEPSQSPH